MLYLLDTNIVSAVEKDFAGSAARQLEQLDAMPGTRIGVSVISAMEIRYGLRKKGSAKLAARIERILSAIEIVPLDETSLEAYAVLRVDLEKRGLPIGAHDMLIAAHALALDATLITDNVREFRRVKGLRVENWLRSKPV